MKQVKGTVNRVELIGWIGNAPEQRTLPSGVMVCNFNIATKRLAGRNDAGERTFETDWKPFPVFLWEPMFQPALHGPLERFLAQGKDEATSLASGYAWLEKILSDSETEN